MLLRSAFSTMQFIYNFVISKLPYCTTDIDECDPSYGHECSNNNTHCHNLDGSVECICDDGFEGDPGIGCTGKVNTNVCFCVFC